MHKLIRLFTEMLINCKKDRILNNDKIVKIVFAKQGCICDIFYTHTLYIIEI